MSKGCKQLYSLPNAGCVAAKFDSICQRQIPDEEKRRRADFIIDTVSAHIVKLGADMKPSEGLSVVSFANNWSADVAGLC